MSAGSTFSIGGWSEHLHLLISLGRGQTIAKVAVLIKGESSHWLNQQNLFRGKFYRQDDYFALSVSEAQVEKVRAYIHNQEEHHKAAPFSQEYDRFRNIAGGRLGESPVFVDAGVRCLKATAMKAEDTLPAKRFRMAER